MAHVKAQAYSTFVNGRLTWVYPGDPIPHSDPMPSAPLSRLETDAEVRKRLIDYVQAVTWPALDVYHGKELDEVLKTYGMEPRKNIPLNPA